ncbi:MAG TPA: PQQ-binding-like beta-propeller repeat protein [Gammaproteobacteria bacterium]|jgi:quinoprotein glucose dehydrogenase|nr:PQQ-binding-like beta-propeller repeat protein [Gammaproteobacteria bacterium]
MRCAVVTLFMGVAALLGVAPAVAQHGAPNGEWKTYGGDLGNTRYSPLAEITAANFNRLEIAWRFKTDSLGPTREYNFQSTPLMVDGVVYSTAGSRRAVVALDAGNGELLWMHREDEGARGKAAPRQLSGRGLAYWKSGNDARILYVTPGYQLIALDARTGLRVPTFGKDGVVDLKQNDDQDIDPLNGEIGLHATPVVAKDVVIVGAAHRTGANPKSARNVKGYVRGFDVRTGERLWIFHTIPQPGEFGTESWLKGSNEYTGNTGVWAQISVDEELETVYLPVEEPTGDYFGANRPGDGLFGETLLAVDLYTGKRKWHYQLVHHGIWDNDIPCAPILIDVTVDGKRVKAVAQPTKQAFLYVFDRVTGKPVWPIVEKPVPKGDVPGEWYSPTQPIPTKPPAYDRQGVTENDLIDFTPALRKEALEIVKWHKMGPLFTPPVVSDINGPLGTLMAPSQDGGTNWQGGAFDPETHVLYVPSASTVVSKGLVPPYPGQSEMAYVEGNAVTGARTSGGSGSAAGGGRSEFQGAQREAAKPADPSRGPPRAALNVQGLPLLKPPYGSITAIDMDRGATLWRIAHGETPDDIRNNPALKGLSIPRTGQTGSQGLLVTKTLVVSGERLYTTTATGELGAMLRAYDKASGREVGAVYMPAPQSGSPMTYQWNGEQYLVVAISGAQYPGELLAFKLPKR